MFVLKVRPSFAMGLMRLKTTKLRFFCFRWRDKTQQSINLPLKHIYSGIITHNFAIFATKIIKNYKKERIEI